MVVPSADRGISIPDGYLDQVLLEFARAPNVRQQEAERLLLAGNDRGYGADTRRQA